MTIAMVGLAWISLASSSCGDLGELKKTAASYLHNGDPGHKVTPFLYARTRRLNVDTAELFNAYETKEKTIKLSKSAGYTLQRDDLFHLHEIIGVEGGSDKIARISHYLEEDESKTLFMRVVKEDMIRFPYARGRILAQTDILEANSFEARKLKLLPAETVVQLYHVEAGIARSRDDNFYKVKIGNTVGWVFYRYFEFAERNARIGLPEGYLVRPVPGSRVTSHYGWRIHPIHNVPRLHAGTDFSGGRGTAVVAAMAGLGSSQIEGGCGNVLRIQDGKFEVRNCHLNYLPSNGIRYMQGDYAGQVGQSGDVTGPHLHFEVKKDGESINPINCLGRRC